MLRSARPFLVIAVGVLVTTPGCFVFDASLYQRYEDGGPPAGDGGSADAAPDAAAIDAGPPLLALADDCTGAVPSLAPMGASTFRTVDLTTLADDFLNLSCTGRPRAVWMGSSRSTRRPASAGTFTFVAVAPGRIR